MGYRSVHYGGCCLVAGALGVNAEDCPTHSGEIDVTIFYPWICDCTDNGGQVDDRLLPAVPLAGFLR